MRLMSLLACVVITSVLAHALTITQAEYYVDSDPGEGFGTSIAITSGESVSFSSLPISTVGLDPDKLHSLYVRYLSNEGYWSLGEGRYFYPLQASSGALNQINIVSGEYWFDGDAPTAFDVPDSPEVSYPALVPSSSLQDNTLHTFHLRYLDDDGSIALAEGRYFYVLATQAGNVQIKTVTQLEYWFDSDAPTQVDLTDAPEVNFADLIPPGTDSGIHTFNLRFLDDEGVWSFAETRRFVIISELAGSITPKNIVAAEYFINGDPGPGGAIAIPTPVDGTYDEGDEEAAVVVSGLPIGLHLFCIRYQDSEGIWTPAFCDSVYMSPILVIQPSGTDIVLSWFADPLHVPFHVYRSPTPDGTFTEIGTSDSLGYLDAGVLGTSDEQNIYHVRTTSGALSTFRLPEASGSQRRVK
ncbi:MAG: hypothetical protein KDB65_08535 [Calditrichaeota bacterium]|nr:hypothetical protein [Calditrichota bacterium]MCB9369818.1 hypothetical protein [Calditrichota bacterium]